jgi:phage-related protein
VIAEVFSKKTRATPKNVIDTCQRRFRAYDAATEDEED